MQTNAREASLWEQIHCHPLQTVQPSIVQSEPTFLSEHSAQKTRNQLYHWFIEFIHLASFLKLGSRPLFQTFLSLSPGLATADQWFHLSTSTFKAWPAVMPIPLCRHAVMPMFVSYHHPLTPRSCTKNNNTVCLASWATMLKSPSAINGWMFLL